MSTPPALPAAAIPATIAREPILVIADVLQSELGLADGAVMLSYEKWNIPKTPGLYIALAYLGPERVISSVNEFDDETNQEIQQLTVLHMVQIDFMSFDASARVRKEEAVMALASILSQQSQERYNLQIARQPSPFVDTSSLEETKRLNRFTTTIAVTALHVKKKGADYFDKFNQRAGFIAQVNPPEVHENV